MRSLLAVEVGWTQLSLIVGGVLAGGALFGSFLYRAKTAYKHAETNANDEKNKLAQQTSDMREHLLVQYRQLYELEKQRGERDIAELKGEITELKDELKKMQSRYSTLHNEHAQLRQEHDRAIALNLRLQDQVNVLQGKQK